MNISNEIIKWYKINKRELPWRNTKNPYEIWISEVILQQTRVIQALNYYYAFLQAFPNVVSLAKANELEVLKLWQGLGYYSRARNLHYSAKYIAKELNGKFPDTFETLKSLKGVGEYTAAAIASFAFNERVPVVDGNVYRVLARLFAETSPINSSNGKKIFNGLATELIKLQNPADFNQAIMEFGALQCIPSKPNCLSCPLNSVCIAFKTDKVHVLPVKNKTKKKQNRYFNYFFIENKGSTYIKKRTDNDIWKGLFEFPMIETPQSTDFSKITKSKSWKSLFNGSKITLHSVSNSVIHQLSHQNIHTTFYRISTSPVSNNGIFKKSFQKISLQQLMTYPVPKLIENFISSNITSTLTD